MPAAFPAGRNIHAELSCIAREIGDEAIANKAVEGVVFLGSLARGFMDESSDLDISIVAGGRNARGLRRSFGRLANEIQSSKGVEADIEVHGYDDFARREWGEIERFSFQHCQIYYDRNGRVERIIREKLRVPGEFWTRRIAEFCVYLSGYASPGREGKSTAENWVRRGDLVQAHYCASYAADLVIQLTYALNREFLPPPKWRIFNMRHLAWRPAGLEEAIPRMLTAGSLDEGSLVDRLSGTREVWPKLMERIEEAEGMDLEAVNAYYNERIVYGR